MPLTPDHSKEPIGTVGELIDLLSKFERGTPLETAYGDNMTRGSFEGLFVHEGNTYVFPGTVVLVSDWGGLRDEVLQTSEVHRG